MAPISTLIRVELTKLIRRPMTWVLAVVLVGLFVMVYASLIGVILAAERTEGGIEGIDPDELRATLLLPDGIFFGAMLFEQIGTILLIILAAGSFGSEFSWATLRTNVMMGASRLRLLVAKLLAMELVAFIAIAIGLALTFVGSLVSELILGNAETNGDWTTASFLGDVLLAVAVPFITIGVWVLIAAAITVITHSLATGLGVTLALSLLGGQIALVIGLLGTVGTWISRVLPNAATDALGALLASDPPEYAASDWLWIAANLVGWTALVIYLAVSAFRRMNLLATAA
jgi:ABC-type transport system involved in multi-copper enzyme maturation permease subunit